MIIDLSNGVETFPVMFSHRTGRGPAPAAVSKGKDQTDMMATPNLVQLELKSDKHQDLGHKTIQIIAIQSDKKDELKPSFKYIKTNIPGPGCDPELFTEMYEGCMCKDTCDITSCSCLSYFGCSYSNDGSLRRLSPGLEYCETTSNAPILECGNECLCCKNSCMNRVVQKGVSGSFIVFHAEGKGYGLKTPKPIKQSSFVCEYAGEVVSDAEARSRLKHCDTSGQSNYLIVLKENSGGRVLRTCVDPKRYGNLGRFINHSCDPNLIMIPVRVNHSVPRLALFARRNINKDEELTFDYSGNASIIPLGMQLSSYLDSTHQDRCNEGEAITCQLSQKDDDLPSCCQDGVDDASVGQETTRLYDKTRLSDNIRCGPSARKHRKVLDNTGSDNCYDSVLDLETSSKLGDCAISDVVGKKSNLINEGTATFHICETSNVRLPCLCGSDNCVKFLPFDSSVVR